MERRLTELWYRPAGRPSLLQPLAWAYGAVVRARRSAYERGWLRAQAVGKPVVVVGNLTVGGTGKTPLTLWLIEKLRDRGLQVGVVSRGYRRLGGDAPVRAARPDRQHPQVVRADSSWEEVGDEPLLLRRRGGCITVVAGDRVAAARQLAVEPVDVILSDDGLQHLRLARDCEIAVIDGARGFGNGRLLPAGPLREPASRLRRVDLVVVNGGAEHLSLTRGALAGAAAPTRDAAPTPAGAPASGGVLAEAGALGRPVLRMTLAPGLAHRVDGAGSAQPLEAFRGGRLHAVAGIGNPERFFRELEGRGLEAIRHPFPDHHPFTAGELAFPDDLPILMTEKDAVRCARWATPRMWYIPVTAQLDDADSAALLDRVCGCVAAAAERIAAAEGRKR